MMSKVVGLESESLQESAAPGAEVCPLVSADHLTWYEGCPNRQEKMSVTNQKEPPEAVVQPVTGTRVPGALYLM